MNAHQAVTIVMASKPRREPTLPSNDQRARTPVCNPACLLVLPLPGYLLARARWGHDPQPLHFTLQQSRNSGMSGREIRRRGDNKGPN